jgi:nicotinamidase-related amidase
MLHRTETVLVILDVQQKLMPVIDGADGVIRNLERLIRGMHVLDVPVIVTEQYVRGLGPTVDPVRIALEEAHGYRPVEKTSFSAYASGEFLAEMRALRRKQIIVAGVETHVCVYQTVSDLIGAGHEVTIVGDAVSSRTAQNRDFGIRRMVADGAQLSTTEMLLFELLGTAGTDEFKAISRLVK